MAGHGFITSICRRQGGVRLSASVVLALAGAAVVFGVTPASRAQEMTFNFGGGSGIGGMGVDAEPPFNTKMLARYAQQLGFDDAQKEAATALLEGMQAEHQAIGKKMNEKLEEVRSEFQESRDPSVFTQKLPGAMRELGMARGKLEQSFVADIKSLLTPEQEAKWPVVERTIRRERTIGQSRLAGEGVDIVRLVDDLKLPADVEAKVRPMLEQYEADVDRPLVERNDLQKKARDLGPSADPAAIEKIREQAREARLRIKEINERYARQIQPELSGELGDKFRAEFQKRAFPEIYGESHTLDSVRAALGFDDLTPEQKATLASIRESYEREAARLNEQWAGKLEDWQKTPEGYMSSAMPGGMRTMGNDAAQSDPTTEPRQARLELDKKAMEQIKGVLSEAQRERLPKRADRRRGMPSFTAAGPGGGGAAVAGGGDQPVVLFVQGDPANPPPPGAAGVAVVREVVTDDKGNVIHDRTETQTLGPDGQPIPPAEGEGGDEEEEVEVVHPAPAPAPQPPAQPQ